MEFARVERWAEDSGNAALAGRELPPDEVLAVDQRITWWAGELRNAGLAGGMDAIRATMAANLDAIHGDTLSADDAKAIAESVQAQVDFMVETCVLAAEVDEQFHLVLGQVLEGVSDLEAGDATQAGAVKIVEALKAYGEHFEHPGWEPLA